MSFKTTIYLSILIAVGVVTWIIVQTILANIWLLLIPAFPAIITVAWFMYNWAAVVRERRLLIRAQRKAEENRAAIVSTPHADYSFRQPDQHIIQLSGNPWQEWNGQARDISPDEWRAWFTRETSKIPEGFVIEQPAQLPAPQLPTMVQLADLLPGMRGNLDSLILGVEATPYGLQNVTISLYDLFHTIAAGSTGWGKSAFVNNVLLQLATCPDPVEFVLIDQQAHGLAPFSNCDRLRYPLLRQPGEILSALRELHSEAIGKRADLFGRYDADDLREYNRLSDNYLPPVIVAVDEASALLTGDKEISAELKRQAWELRKFGVYQFLMLTSAKGTTIDTDHRQQFASKVQLHANDKSQARLLFDASEAITFPPGRAVIELPQRQPVTVQTPYVDKRTVRSFLRPGVIPNGPVAVERPGIETKERQWVELVKDGMSKNAASLQVFERPYGGDLVRLNRFLGSSTTESI